MRCLEDRDLLWEFDKKIIDSELWENDWFWSDDELECIETVEYRLYEKMCREALEDG